MKKFKDRPLTTRYLLIIFPLIILMVAIILNTLIPLLKAQRGLDQLENYIANVYLTDRLIGNLSWQLEYYYHMSRLEDMSFSVTMEEIENENENIIEILHKQTDQTGNPKHIEELAIIATLYKDIHATGFTFMELCKDNRYEEANLLLEQELKPVVRDELVSRIDGLAKIFAAEYEWHMMHLYGQTRQSAGPLSILITGYLDENIKKIQLDIEKILLGERLLRYVSRDLKEHSELAANHTAVNLHQLLIRQTDTIALFAELEEKLTSRDPEQLMVFKQIMTSYRELLIDLEQIGNFEEETLFDEALIFIEQNCNEKAYLLLRNDLHEFINGEREQLAIRIDELQVIVNYIGLGTTLLSLFALLLIGSTIWLLQKHIIAPLLILNSTAADLAKGMLGARAAVETGDELGDLAKSFNKMADKLEKNICHLQDISLHDELTGVYNRYYFKEELDRLEGGRNYPISIISADLNNLKDVNDIKGHFVGDELLKTSVKLLKSPLRSNDFITRLGGDEFVIILPQTDEKTSGNVLKRIQETILNYNQTKPALPVSISLGMATATNADYPLSKAFELADTMMYINKKSFKEK